MQEAAAAQCQPPSSRLCAERRGVGEVGDVREEGVAFLVRGVQVLGDEDGDDERVHGNDTGHDDGDQALWRVRRRCSVQGDGFERDGAHTFMMRSGRNVPTPAIPMPDLAVP